MSIWNPTVDSNSGVHGASLFVSYTGPAQGYLSRKETSWLYAALRLAALSEMSRKHGAIIVKGGRVLAFGINVNKGLYSMHAEMVALNKCNKEELKGASIYVARVSNGEPRMSRPCDVCQHAIADVGIKKVFYTEGVEVATAC